ncbi:hypothetical protein OV208_09625 [Corallococcus sp. bb12-1]|uniref:hypothetical protein n=1 Tax=Corallococcus sp. bb12-1 TaxID=2996784 RepID=UPI00226EA441|nr:hypothetical protein [Corallococcus sp. bb12-1]MCY1041573.1 hypothetical protein [Corallococcus sp. bb12-1]
MFANPSAARRPYRAPLASLFAVALLATSAGCAGGLDDPDRFTGGTGGACATSTTATGIIQAQCFACHSTSSKEIGAGLDLQAPGLPGRLYTTTSSAACGAVPMADSANPANSLFLKKLTPTPGCGTQMPQGNPLSEAESACLKEWLVNGKPSSP